MAMHIIQIVRNAWFAEGRFICMRSAVAARIGMRYGRAFPNEPTDSEHMPAKSDATHPNAESFPPVGGPALRALARAGIRSLTQLAQWNERDLLALHGMGPKGVRILKAALAAQDRHLRAE